MSMFSKSQLYGSAADFAIYLKCRVRPRPKRKCYNEERSRTNQTLTMCSIVLQRTLIAI